MRSYRRLLAQLCFVLAAVAFASTATAAKSFAAFQAVIAITEQAGPDPTGTCPTGFAGLISGTGDALHMGKVTLTSFDCIEIVGPGVFLFSSNRVVLTAANGDQVFGEYSGAVDAQNGVGVVSGQFKITSGTGRFVNATGGGILQGLEEIDFATGTGRGHIRLSGTISY